MLAVLTGADWEASGWRDLPSAAGNKRRDGSPDYRPHFLALVKDRVRWVGDYVAFVVAETLYQAVGGIALVEVSVDGGESWPPAQIEPRRQWSWQRFMFEWRPPPAAPSRAPARG